MANTIEIDVGILDMLTRRRLHSEQIRCLLVVLSRPGKALTLGDFQSATGVSKPHVCRAIKFLTGNGLLGVTRDESGRRYYRIPGFIHRAGIPERNRAEQDGVNLAIPFDQMPVSPAEIISINGHVATNGRGAVSTSGNKLPHSAMQMPISGNGIPADGNNISTDGPFFSIGGNADAIPGNVANSAPASNMAAVAVFKKEHAVKAAWEAEFGCRLPDTGFDPEAIQIMLDRRKSGKLGPVKNPVGYLKAMGRITGPAETRHEPGSKPVAIHPEKPVVVSVDDYNRKRAVIEAWQKMTDEDRKPYYEKAKQMKPTRLNVSIDFLAQMNFRWDHESVKGIC